MKNIIEQRLAALKNELDRRQANINILQGQMDNETHQINACLGGIQTLEWLLQQERQSPSNSE